MKNGILHTVGARRPRSLLLGILCLVLVLVSLAGCRSSRSAVEETQREVHSAVSETHALDTLSYSAAAREESLDTAELRADERAVIEISRDSAGRVIGIFSTASTKINASARRQAERDRWFYGLNATRSSEAADTVDSLTQKKEEAKKEINVGIPLECIIGWSIAAAVILFYIADCIYRQWKKRQGK